MEERKTSKQLLGELLDKHYADALEAKKNGQLVAWATSIAPQELLTAMAPMMIEDGYPANFAVCVPAAAGCIGVIIPPSIPFVNYAVLTGVSISDMKYIGDGANYTAKYIY